jgi:hypothetical protein
MTESEIKYEEARAIKQNSKFIEYADQLLCISLHENCGFGRERFYKFNSEAAELGRWYIDRYKEENENAEDYAVNGYYALVRDLRGFGWIPELKLWNDNVFDQFPPDKNSAAMRKLHAQCLEYAKGVSFYVRESLCIEALWLCEEHGWRAVRLDRLVKPVVEAYLGLMQQYLRCSKEGVKELNARCRAVKKRYDAMGIFLSD